jgi:hypothetical protein
MTAVFAVLLVLGAIVLCTVAWRTRHHHDPDPEWDEAELRAWKLQLPDDTIEYAAVENAPPWPLHPPEPARGRGGGHVHLITHDDTALWEGHTQIIPAAQDNAIGDLTDAGDRIRAMTLDEYEAALPAFPHHPAWYATLGDGAA